VNGKQALNGPRPCRRDWRQIAIICLRSLKRRRFHVGLLAITLATFVHMLALVALCDWQQPPMRASQAERAPLIARLLQPEGPIPSAPVFEGTTNTTMRRVASRKQSHDATSRRRVPQELAHVTPANEVPAPLAEKPDLDWQADLGSITSHQSIRYPNVQQIAPTPSAESSLHQGTAAEILAREVSKATRGDCRKAYSHMGLLAIPMLAFDAMNRSGCRW
jgi:hypothetical protein